MGPLRSGPRGRTDGVGQYKTCGMRYSIRAQRERARSALFYRVIIKQGLKLHTVCPIYMRKSQFLLRSGAVNNRPRLVLLFSRPFGCLQAIAINASLSNVNIGPQYVWETFH